VTIRPARLSDRQEIQVLQAANRKPVEACVLGPQLEALLADPDRLVLVADSGRRVVGAISAREGEIDELLIDPEWQRIADDLRGAVS
jgi:hypothetical protein